MLKTMRPHQWVKNVFVLAPVVFAKEIFDPALMIRAVGAFGVFCLLAGAVYTINDISDVRADREHPAKRYRPIPSGRVPIPLARRVALLLLVAALAGAAAGSLALLAVAIGYFLLNLAYSSRLKHVAYVDVACIALGFVLRVMAGGFAAQIEASQYLLLCTALLAMFLGFGKRRHELAAGLAQAKSQRAVMQSYTLHGLDLALVVTSVCTLVTYVAYTLDSHTRSFFGNDWLWISSILVGLGVTRFLQLVRTRPAAESPTQEMLTDWPFLTIMLCWGGLVMWVIFQLPSP